jgi:3-hydroxyisobutyrate dehydrogenase
LKVGFIGMGHQGLPMAQRIVEAGFPTALWARRLATLEPFQGSSARVVTSPAQLGAASDLVGVCVFDGAGVREVLFAEDGVVEGMAPGGIVTVHSTVAPDEIRAIAARAAKRDITVLDAPVSGGPVQAASGRLVVLLGGPGPACERSRPVIATYSDRIIHVGDVGSAQLAKLVNNVVMTAHLGLAIDTFRFGEQLGLDRNALNEVLLYGSGRSYSIEVLVGLGSVEALARTNATPTLAKDIELVSALGGNNDAISGVLLPTARHLIDLLQAALAGEGGGRS